MRDRGFTVTSADHKSGHCVIALPMATVVVRSDLLHNTRRRKPYPVRIVEFLGSIHRPVF